MLSPNTCLVLALGLSGLFSQIRADEQATSSDPLAETSDRDFNRSFKKISDYLTEHVDTDDIEPNLKAAREWLTKDLEDKPDVDERLVDALKLFISLEDTSNGEKCDRSGHDILFNNLLATEQCGRGRQTEYRTDRIVYKFLHDHAKRCLNKYPVSFESIYSKMDRAKRSQVEFFLNDWNLKEFLGVSLNRHLFYLSLVRNRDRIQGKKAARMAYDVIYALSTNDKDREYLTQKGVEGRKEKIGDLFKKYIIEPCKYFVDELGPDVYVPVRFDAMFYHRVNEENFRFYDSWARFRICSYVIDNESSFKYQLVNDSAESEPSVENQ